MVNRDDEESLGLPKLILIIYNIAMIVSIAIE